MKTEKSAVTIMCPSGKFYRVRAIGKLPEIGEDFTGKVLNKKIHYNKFIAAACLCFMLIGSSAYAYCAPAATILVNINPSIEIKTNIFGKIVACKALNDDGSKVLKDINIKNKSLVDGLNSILDQSKIDNFIDDNYIETGKTIRIEVSTKNNKQVDLSGFEKYLSNNNLNADIVNAGIEKRIEGNKNSDENAVKDSKNNTSNTDSSSTDKKNNSSNSTDNNSNVMNNSKNSNANSDNDSTNKNTVKDAANQNKKNDSDFNSSNDDSSNNNTKNNAEDKTTKGNSSGNSNINNDNNSDHHTPSITGKSKEKSPEPSKNISDGGKSKNR